MINNALDKNTIRDDVESVIAEAKKTLIADATEKGHRITVVEGQCERLYNELEVLQTQAEGLEAAQPKLLDSLKRQVSGLTTSSRYLGITIGRAAWRERVCQYG